MDQFMKTPPPGEVGVFDAKTNLSALIERVERGESIVITRHGAPVAKLVPFADFVDRAKVREAAARLMTFGEADGLKLPAGTTISDLLNEGRR